MFKSGELQTRTGVSRSLGVLRGHCPRFSSFKSLKPSPIHSQKAFTLPEILLATAILAIALSGLLSLYCNILLLNQIRQSQFTAATHGGYVMEDIRNTTFSSVATSITGGTWNLDSSELTALGLTPLYNEQISTSSTGSDPLDVTVTVTWTDSKQRSETLTLKTKLTSQ